MTLPGIMVATMSCLSLWFSEPPGAGATTPTYEDPIAILRRTSAAAKAASVVQYKTTVQPFGKKPTPPRLEGTVLMSGWKDKGPEKYKYDVTIRPMETSGEQRVTVGSDGQQYYVIDHDNRKVYVGAESTTLGSFAASTTSFPIIDFVRPTPFENEIVSGNVELKGTSLVGGQECHEMKITYPPGRDKVEALWFISKKDFLPRRLDFARTRGTADRLGWQYMLTDLVLDAPFDPDRFKLVVPAGFETLNQPAP